MAKKRKKREQNGPTKDIVKKGLGSQLPLEVNQVELPITSGPKKSAEVTEKATKVAETVATSVSKASEAPQLIEPNDIEEYLELIQAGEVIDDFSYILSLKNSDGSKMLSEEDRIQLATNVLEHGDSDMVAQFIAHYSKFDLPDHEGWLLLLASVKKITQEPPVDTFKSFIYELPEVLRIAILLHLGLSRDEVIDHFSRLDLNTSEIDTEFKLAQELLLENRVDIELEDEEDDLDEEDSTPLEEDEEDDDLAPQGTLTGLKESLSKNRWLGIPASILVVLFALFLSRSKPSDTDVELEAQAVELLAASDESDFSESDLASMDPFSEIPMCFPNDGQFSISNDIAVTQELAEARERLLSTFGFRSRQVTETSERTRSPYIEISDGDISTATQVANEQSLIDVSNPNNFTQLRSGVTLEPNMPLRVNTLHSGPRGHLSVRNSQGVELGALRRGDQVFLPNQIETRIFSVNGVPTVYYGITVREGREHTIKYVAGVYLMSDQRVRPTTPVAAREDSRRTERVESVPVSQPAPRVTVTPELRTRVTVVPQETETTPRVTVSEEPRARVTVTPEPDQQIVETWDRRSQFLDYMRDPLRRSLEDLYLASTTAYLSIAQSANFNENIDVRPINFRNMEMKRHFITEVSPLLEEVSRETVAIHILDLSADQVVEFNQRLRQIEITLNRTRRVPTLNREAKSQLESVVNAISTFRQRLDEDGAGRLIEILENLHGDQASSNTQVPETPQTENVDDRLASMTTEQLVAELQSNPEAYIGKRFTYVSQRSGVAREYEFAGLNQNGHIQLRSGITFAVRAENVKYLSLSAEPVQQELAFGVEEVRIGTGERVDYALAT